MTLMLSIALIEASVRGQLDGQVTASAPSFVLMNVDKASLPGLNAFAKADARVTSLSFTPFLRGVVTQLQTCRAEQVRH